MLNSLVLITAFLVDTGNTTQAAALGERIFHDTRFSNRRGDMHTSCASCHMVSDPQGDRAFTELLARSWRPWRSEDPARETLRNTPTLFDVAHSPLIHLDGEFVSLEEQSFETLLGRNLGWLPGERREAAAHIHSVLKTDETYSSMIQSAYGVDVAAIDALQSVGWTARALATFMRGLTSRHDAPYDDFMDRNGLDSAPAENETVKDYAARTLERAIQLDAAGRLQFSGRFDRVAFEGFKLFFTTTGPAKTGNCVTCHIPPHFTDFAFHNTGVSQEEYDRYHGSEAFLKLEIPNGAEIRRPMAQFMHAADRRDPSKADLGYWNFADLRESPYRRPGETDENFLERLVATFKTPTLRHLASTDPYMHNGAYPTVEAAVEQKITAGFRARMGQVRNPDPELPNIRLDYEDVPLLFAFLNTLNEQSGRVSVPRRESVSPEGASYRYNRDY